MKIFPKKIKTSMFEERFWSTGHLQFRKNSFTLTDPVIAGSTKCTVSRLLSTNGLEYIIHRHSNKIV